MTEAKKTETGPKNSKPKKDMSTNKIGPKIYLSKKYRTIARPTKTGPGPLMCRSSVAQMYTLIVSSSIGQAKVSIVH